jgi:IS4 transposase
MISTHKADHYRKHFNTLKHLKVLLIAQYAGTKSLDEIAKLINMKCWHHYHLSMKPLATSTLSDANKNRSAAVFHDFAQHLITQLRQKDQKEIEQLLTILDSSPIRLAGRGYAWAKALASRPGSEGLKLHLQYDATTHHIEYCEITDSNVNDISVATALPLHPHRLYVFDKGYCSYTWWKAIHDHGSLFATRLKKNTTFSVVATRMTPEKDRHYILKDELIELTGDGKKNPLHSVRLRRIEVPHPSDKKRVLVIVSNALEASTDTIAGTYKKRWEIELLFKWLKQNLKIKRFMGENKNAVMIQIYVAMIAYLLLKEYQQRVGKLHERLKDVAHYIRYSPFDAVHREADYRRRHKPIPHPTNTPIKKQLELEIFA